MGNQIPKLDYYQDQDGNMKIELGDYVYTIQRKDTKRRLPFWNSGGKGQIYCKTSQLTYRGFFRDGVLLNGTISGPNVPQQRIQVEQVTYSNVFAGTLNNIPVILSVEHVAECPKQCTPKVWEQVQWGNWSYPDFYIIAKVDNGVLEGNKKRIMDILKISEIFDENGDSKFIKIPLNNEEERSKKLDSVTDIFCKALEKRCREKKLTRSSCMATIPSTLRMEEEKEVIKFLDAPMHLVNSLNEEHNICVICTDKLKGDCVYTKCFHFFHRNCVQNLKKDICPMCQKPL